MVVQLSSVEEGAAEAARLPKKQLVPGAWLAKDKTVRDLVKKVAPAVLGRTSVVTDRVSLLELAGGGKVVEPSVPLRVALCDGASYGLREERGGGAPEPPPAVSTRTEYAAIKTTLKVEGLALSQLAAWVRTPSGAAEAACVETAAAGATGSGSRSSFIIRYAPRAPGSHSLEVMIDGEPAGEARRFEVQPGAQRPSAWTSLSELEVSEECTRGSRR